MDIPSNSRIFINFIDFRVDGSDFESHTTKSYGKTHNQTAEKKPFLVRKFPFSFDSCQFQSNDAHFGGAKRSFHFELILQLHLHFL